MAGGITETQRVDIFYSLAVAFEPGAQLAMNPHSVHPHLWDPNKANQKVKQYPGKTFLKEYLVKYYRVNLR